MYENIIVLYGTIKLTNKVFNVVLLFYRDAKTFCLNQLARESWMMLKLQLKQELILTQKTL